ncbi:MAG: hypothetical protein WAN35_01000 [Terracidiphilus sp.]|jgi:hypothetical protein
MRQSFLRESKEKVLQKAPYSCHPERNAAELKDLRFVRAEG